MGFLPTVFCFSFLLGGAGVKSVFKQEAIKPFQGSLHGPLALRQAAAEANFLPDESNKRCEQSFFVKHFKSDYSNSEHRRGGMGLWWHCVSFRSVFHVPKIAPRTAQGRAGHLPSQPSVDVLAQTQHANLAQAFCSSLQGVPQENETPAFSL